MVNSRLSLSFPETIVKNKKIGFGFMEEPLLCSSLPENMPGKRETFYFMLKLPVREKWNRSPGKSSLELVEAAED